MALTRFTRLLVSLSLLAAVAGCGGSAIQLRPDGIQTEARQAYMNGLVELESGNYQEAIRYFQQVAASPSYFRYTALASLRVADALYYQEQFARAVEAYQGFIKRFAGNPNIPYAQFRVAQCHYHRMAGDWWFMPPAYEKDLSATRAAYDSLSRFLARHPRHRFAPQARRMKTFAAERLFDFEMYVADFYEGRDRPRGIAQRLESALAKFPEAASTEENYVRLARAYADAGDGPATKRTLERYLAAFPQGERADEVTSWLETLTAPQAGDDGDAPADDEMDDEMDDATSDGDADGAPSDDGDDEYEDEE